jgi:hypothetical protein
MSSILLHMMLLLYNHSTATTITVLLVSTIIILLMLLYHIGFNAAATVTATLLLLRSSQCVHCYTIEIVELHVSMRGTAGAAILQKGLVLLVDMISSKWCTVVHECCISKHST